MDSDQVTGLLNSAGLITGGGGLNWWNIIAGIVFGGIGFVAFMYGKKEKSAKPLIIGLILMVYPYVVPNTFFLYAIGIGLSALLYFWRD